MANPISQAASAVKTVGSQLGSVASRVSSVKGAAMSFGKWLAVGLAVAVASTTLVPWLQRQLLKIPFLSKYIRGSQVIAGFSLMLVGALLSMVKFVPVQFVAAGVGLSGAFAVALAIVKWVMERVSPRLAQQAAVM